MNMVVLIYFSAISAKSAFTLISKIPIATGAVSLFLFVLVQKVR